MGLILLFPYQNVDFLSLSLSGGILWYAFWLVLQCYLLGFPVTCRFRLIKSMLPSFRIIDNLWVVDHRAKFEKVWVSIQRAHSSHFIGRFLIFKNFSCPTAYGMKKATFHLVSPALFLSVLCPFAGVPFGDRNFPNNRWVDQVDWWLSGQLLN